MIICMERLCINYFFFLQSEIAAISGEDEEDKTTVKHSQEELEAMVGNHYRAPFTEKWGGLSYHNAVILSLVTQKEGDVNLVDPEARMIMICIYFDISHVCCSYRFVADNLPVNLKHVNSTSCHKGFIALP